MKNILIIAFAALFSVGNLQAQKKKKTQTVKIEEKVSKENPNEKIVTIEKEVNGKKTVEEKVIKIDAPRTRTYTFTEGFEGDTLIEGERELKYGDGFSWEESFPQMDRRLKDRSSRYRFNLDDLSNQIERGFRFEPSDFRQNGIYGVNIFTNMPDTHILNLKFKSNDNANVSISVVNSQGNLVSKKEVENFSGEFIGQMELDKGAKGLFFVLISQGENGTSRSIKID